MPPALSTHSSLRLLRLLRVGEILPAAQAAQILRVAPADIDAFIDDWRSRGIAIEKQPSGYSLLEPLDLLDAQYLNASLPIAVEVVDECASTNSLLLEGDERNEGEARVLACESQTAGRGRRGAVWHSFFADSLSFSLLWPFNSGARALAGLPLAVGVACVRACDALGLGPVRLKWPNDLLLEGRKLGGVLIELRPGTTHAVIGVGINLRNASRHQAFVEQPIAALSDAGMPLPSRNLLLQAFVSEMVDMAKRFDLEGFAAFRSEWSQLHAHAGRAVRLVDGARQIDGIAAGVGEDGALLLRTDEGERRILAGELSLRLAA